MGGSSNARLYFFGSSFLVCSQAMKGKVEDGKKAMLTLNTPLSWMLIGFLPSNNEFLLRCSKPDVVKLKKYKQIY